MSRIPGTVARQSSAPPPSSSPAKEIAPGTPDASLELRQIAAPPAPLEADALSRRDFARTLRFRLGDTLVQGLRGWANFKREFER